VKQSKAAVRKRRVTRTVRPSTEKQAAPLIEERAAETCALLEQLFSSLDSLRAAAESCGNWTVKDDARTMKARIAESGALFWLRELRSGPFKKAAVQP